MARKRLHPAATKHASLVLLRNTCERCGGRLWVAYSPMSGMKCSGWCATACLKKSCWHVHCSAVLRGTSRLYSRKSSSFWSRSRSRPRASSRMAKRRSGVQWPLCFQTFPINSVTFTISKMPSSHSTKPTSTPKQS